MYYRPGAASLSISIMGCFRITCALILAMAALAQASTSSVRRNASVTTAFKLIQSNSPSAKKYGWAALPALILTPGNGQGINNGRLVNKISAEAKGQGTEDAFRALSLVH
jgi:hypothetical protein